MKSSDLQSTTNHEYIRMFGDVTAGEFREDGSTFNAGELTDPARAAKIKKMYDMNAAMAGATLLPNAKKTAVPVGKKKKQASKKPVVQERYVEEEPVVYVEPKSSGSVGPLPKRYVYLHNKMGKIKMAVEDVLECEMAFCLIFHDEESVIFTPNPAETLNFVDPSGNTHSVYYADTLFGWTDGVKRLMILFKHNKE